MYHKTQREGKHSKHRRKIGEGKEREEQKNEKRW
jgi:hypothetical protein